MRTSLNEIEQIEDHLLQKLNGEEELLFQANLLLNKSFADDFHWQKKSYQLIHTYGRLQLRQEIEKVHQKLFSKPDYRTFRQKIIALFRRR
jgi:hypothetical protein